MANPQESSEERQQRLYEERLQERGQDLVPRHQPAPVEFPVDTSETASLEREPQPHSGCSDVTVVNPHPVLAYQARQRHHHTCRRAQWLFTQAAQVARNEAIQARRLQQAARAQRRLRTLVPRTVVQVQALQMRNGLVAIPPQSSVSPSSSLTTTGEDTDWSQDMEVEEKNNNDDGDGGDDGAGGCCSTAKYGPQTSRRVGKYGTR